MSQWVKKKLSTGLGFFHFLNNNDPSSENELLKLSAGVGSPAIQELDGGFFEKFGTLLREPPPTAETEVVSSEDGAPADDGLSTAAGEIAAGGDGVAEGVSAEGGEAPRRAVVSGRMDISDTEGESSVDEGQKEMLSSAVGWNVEELYTEVLYQIVHNVGCDVVTKSDQEEVCSLLRDAFKMDSEKHQQLLEQAQFREAPKLVLNVEVLEGKDLKPKDANGMSDPFCTLYMNSATTQRYNTSVKQQTLNPTWQEHFSLPVKNPAEDVLTVEVWDFDPAETVKDKMGKLNEVKGVRGLRKLIKEIAQTASTGKHDNELVGSATVALNCIPSAGQSVWCNLERPGKMKRQGMLRVHCSFSAEKNKLVATTEHRNLIRLLLLHHLDSQKAAAYRWKGDWDPRAETILRQHAVQSGLSGTQEALAKWTEFVAVHVDHPLSFTVFAELVAQLKGPLATGQMMPDEEKQFWESTRRLLPSCMNSVRRLRKLASCDSNTITQLAAILSTLAQLCTVKPPPDTDLFPGNVYGWLTSPTDGPNSDIHDVLEDAVLRSGEEWFAYVLSHHQPDDPSDKSRLSHLIQIVQLVRSDLQKAIEFHAKLFQTTVRIRYASALYRIYEAKVSEMVKPVVEEICGNIKPLRFDENQSTANGRSDELLSTGTTLFELYLALQRLSTLGEELCPTDRASLAIASYNQWFYRGVAQWLEMALYKAKQRIEKAVELDRLLPVDASVKYSSSAVDTLSIFYQIKIFWQQLAWPDVEGSYTFVAKIIDDICQCCEFYADKMSKKVDGLGDVDNGTVHEKKFEVTQEWCLAINNIEHVRQSIEPFVAKLGMENIVASLADFRSPEAADHCRETLRHIVDNAVDIIHTAAADLLDAMVEKMSPAIRRFLREGAELLNQDCNSVDRLMQYLDGNLIVLRDNLNEENFDRILSSMWANVAASLLELVESSLEKRRPPSFFAKLQETVNVLIGFFRQEHEMVDDNKLDEETQTKDVGTGKENLRCVRRLLKLHALETHQLAHQFHLRRLAEQKKQSEAGESPAMGQLTVRAQLVFNTLYVEIMNARNLLPSDSNGSCDPYVKVHLLPEDTFATVNKPKTKTQKKCLFPLFDELFTIPLTPEQRSCSEALLLFVIKDQDFIGTNEFLGETYLSLADVPTTDESVSISSLPQVHLHLHKPGPDVLESDVMRALEHRQGDKLAKEFVKRQKTKLAEIKTNGTKP